MDNEKLLKQLHEHEKKILKALEDVKVASVTELEGLTGLVKDSIEKASMWGRVKGIVSIREDKTEFVELTKEGCEKGCEVRFDGDCHSCKLYKVTEKVIDMDAF